MRRRSRNFVRVGVNCNDAAGVFNSRDWPSTRTGDHFVEFSGSSPLDAALSFTEGSTLSFTAQRSGTGLRKRLRSIVTDVITEIAEHTSKTDVIYDVSDRHIRKNGGTMVPYEIKPAA